MFLRKFRLPEPLSVDIWLFVILIKPLLPLFIFYFFEWLFATFSFSTRMQSVSNEDEWSRCEIEVPARCASLDTNGRAVASRRSIRTLSEAGKQLVRKLACRCRPRCTVRTCNHVRFLNGKGKTTDTLISNWCTQR